MVTVILFITHICLCICIYYEEAVKYYKLAAEQKHDKAQFNLGRCYEKGIGVIKDTEEAAKYYKFAADQGHDSAKEKLNESSK